MAAIKRIDLSKQLFEDNVIHKPPLASKSAYTIPKFHNRSSLFPSTIDKKKIFLDEQDSALPAETLIKRPASSKVNVPKPPTSERKYIRNIKSATARLERTKSSDEDERFKIEHERKTDNPLTCYNKNNLISQRVPPHEPVSETSEIKACSDTNNISKSFNDTGNSTIACLELVPVGGKPVPVVDVGWEAPFPEYHYQFNTKEKHKSVEIKPFITPPVDVSLLSMPIDNSHTDDVSQEESHLKPSVYGLTLQRQVFGSDTDLSKTDDNNCPYKLATEIKDSEKDKSYSEKQGKENNSRELPECLEPLSPWLTDTGSIPQSVIGVDPNKCFVFLPSLLDMDYDEIPEVPLPHNIHDDLPYEEKILPEELPPPKKYDHPSFVDIEVERNKKPVEEWVCKHSKTSTRIMSGDGVILHERFSGPRTLGVVRKEIQDLEKLLQGIGTLDSDCMMVRYQAEIDNFRKMYEDTMAKVPERYRYPPEPPEDMFGLRQFYKEHDEVIREIKHEHTICLEELAILEADIGIESDRKYFKQFTKVPSVTS